MKLRNNSLLMKAYFSWYVAYPKTVCEYVRGLIGAFLGCVALCALFLIFFAFLVVLPIVALGTFFIDLGKDSLGLRVVVLLPITVLVGVVYEYWKHNRKTDPTPSVAVQYLKDLKNKVCTRIVII